MFRNQYDTDTITWSPQGRIFQIEYAMEAVKQGTAVIGVRSNTHAAIFCLKRAPSELADHQKKIFPIDEHIGVGISGLTGDARVLCEYLRNEALNHKYVYDAPITISRVIEDMSNMSQERTQRYSQRAYGVGLIVVGYDGHGPQLFETCPSGNFFEYYAVAIGGRSQSAKTYLEKNFESFPECTPDALVMHGLKALSACLAQDAELTVKNVAVGLVGKDTPFKEYTEADLEPLISQLGSGPAPMDTTG
jgi:20S proteasome subunit alpha 6